VTYKRKGFKPIEEYRPEQRGQVAQAQKTRGNKYLKDGDHTPEECPDCGFCLRVKRASRYMVLWCPCGYEGPVPGPTESD